MDEMLQPEEKFPEEKFQVGRSRNFSEISNIRKRASMHVTYNKKKKIFTIVIPYDDEHKKYKIESDDIDFFDDKDYVINKLEKLNQLFNLNEFNIPFFTTIFLFLFNFILIVFVLYVSLILSLLCLLNPILIVVLIGVLIHIIKLLIILFYSVKDYYRKNLIKKILNDENKNCEGLKINWEYGRDGSWLEVMRRE